MLLKCHFLGTVLLRDHVCSIEYYYKFKGRSDELHLVLITCLFLFHLALPLFPLDYKLLIFYSVWGRANWFFSLFFLCFGLT